MLRQVEIEEENGKRRRRKPKKLEDYIVYRLKMNNEKRNLCELANKRDVALRHGGKYIKLYQTD